MRLEESILLFPLSVLSLGLLPTREACEVWSCLTPAEWFQREEAHLSTSHFQTLAGMWSNPKTAERDYFSCEYIYSLCYELFIMCDMLPSTALLKITGVFQNTEKWQKRDQLQEKIAVDAVSSTTLLYFGLLSGIKIPGRICNARVKFWTGRKGNRGAEEKYQLRKYILEVDNAYASKALILSCFPPTLFHSKPEGFLY